MQRIGRGIENAKKASFWGMTFKSFVYLFNVKNWCLRNAIISRSLLLRKIQDVDKKRKKVLLTNLSLMLLQVDWSYLELSWVNNSTVNNSTVTLLNLRMVPKMFKISLSLLMNQSLIPWHDCLVLRDSRVSRSTGWFRISETSKNENSHIMNGWIEIFFSKNVGIYAG